MDCCLTTRALLDKQFDAGDALGAGAEEHLAVCSACSAHVERLGELSLSLHGLMAEVPSAELLQRLHALPPPGKHGVGASLGLATAAAAFLSAAACLLAGVVYELPVELWRAEGQAQLQQLWALSDSLKPPAIAEAMAVLSAPPVDLSANLHWVTSTLPGSVLALCLPLVLLIAWAGNRAALDQVRGKA
jgi:anti-sigma factor RsiW